MTWPEFKTPRVLDDGRAWTATFDSYDQYRELCYYRVRIYEGGACVAELMAKIGIFETDDWTTLAFARELVEQIAAVAATGKSNTEYRG